MRVRKQPYSGYTGHTRDFIKCVDDMARNRSHRDIFADFLEMGYCAIAKRALPQGDQADALEVRYLKAASRGERADYASEAAHLLAHLTLGLQTERDFLGPIAAELSALNGAAGQFFTPWTVCEMMAEMSLQGCTDIIQQRGFITVQEPACGSGAMALAAAKVLREKTHDVERQLFVEATDVSDTCFKMTYLQLALMNIPARVICGNALTGTNYEWAYTPAMLSFIAHHGTRWTNFLSGKSAPEKQALPQNKPRALPTSPLARLRRHALQGVSSTPQVAHRQTAIAPRRLAVSIPPPNAVDAALQSKREDTR